MSKIFVNFLFVILDNFVCLIWDYFDLEATKNVNFELSSLNLSPIYNFTSLIYKSQWK